MAKVTGPLFSMSASGKIADSMVFFGWKGSNVVRQWLKPSNPKSANQGDVRIALGGTGRAAGQVMPNSAFAQQLITLGLIPGGQTKQSYLVKYIVNNYLAGATAYAAALAEYTGHAAYSAFDAAGLSESILEFDLDYATNAPYQRGFGLYLLAKAATVLDFAGTPYTTALASWVTADVTGMVADFQA